MKQEQKSNSEKGWDSSSKVALGSGQPPHWLLPLKGGPLKTADWSQSRFEDHEFLNSQQQIQREFCSGLFGRELSSLACSDRHTRFTVSLLGLTETQTDRARPGKAFRVLELRISHLENFEQSFNVFREQFPDSKFHNKILLRQQTATRTC